MTTTSRARTGPRLPDHPSKSPAKLTRSFYRQVLRQLCGKLPPRSTVRYASAFRTVTADRGR